MGREDEPWPEELINLVNSSVRREEYYLKHPGPPTFEGYDNAIYYAAKCLLRGASQDPTGFKEAMDEYKKSPFTMALHGFLGEKLGLSGYQWGCAVQIAAYLTEQGQVPNPAVITISVKHQPPE